VSVVVGDPVGEVVVVTDGRMVLVFVTTVLTVEVRAGGGETSSVTVRGAGADPVTVTVTGEAIKMVSGTEVKPGEGRCGKSVRLATISPETSNPAEKPARTPTATGPRFDI
jgi:hypothetical protein